MDPVQIHPKVANSDDLRVLAREARELEYERLLPLEVLDKLDPNGNHLIFPRPDGTPLTDDAKPDADGNLQRSKRMDLSLLENIPCEVFMKLRGQKEPAKAMLDISLLNMLKLKGMQEARAELGLYRITDGDNRFQR